MDIQGIPLFQTPWDQKGLLTLITGVASFQQLNIDVLWQSKVNHMVPTSGMGPH